MITPELVEFIRNSKKAGHDDDVISQNLRAGGGWTQLEIDEATRVAMMKPKSKLPGKIIKVAIFLIIIGAAVYVYVTYPSVRSEIVRIFDVVSVAVKKIIESIKLVLS